MPHPDPLPVAKGNGERKFHRDRQFRVKGVAGRLSAFREHRACGEGFHFDQETLYVTRAACWFYIVAQIFSLIEQLAKRARFKECRQSNTNQHNH